MNNNQLFNEVKIMKKIFYQIMGLCSILGVATACNEDPEYFTLDEQPDEMHIVASTDKLVLDKGKEDETAITFTWDAASSPVNETDLVTYSLRLYATANKSANNTDFYELDTDRKRVSRMMNLMLLLVLGCCRGKRLKLLHKSFVPFIMRTNT